MKSNPQHSNTLLTNIVSTVGIFTQQRSKHLMRSISLVTGIPELNLAWAEDQMRRQNSLKPLKKVLEDKRANRGSFLKYRVGLKTKTINRGTPFEQHRASFFLMIKTKKGTFRVKVHLAIRENRMIQEGMQQAAISVDYFLTDQNNRKKQSLYFTLALAIQRHQIRVGVPGLISIQILLASSFKARRQDSFN